MPNRAGDQCCGGHYDPTSGAPWQGETSRRDASGAKTQPAPSRRRSVTIETKFCATCDRYELWSSTVTARRFCDQQEISSHTATGRSLPYEMVRMRCADTPREIIYSRTVCARRAPSAMLYSRVPRSSAWPSMVKAQRLYRLSHCASLLSVSRPCGVSSEESVS